MKRKLTADEVISILDGYKKGQSMRRLAREHKCSTRTIHRVVHKNKLATRSVGRPLGYAPSPRNPIRDNEIVSKSHVSLEKLSEEYGLCTNRLRQIIKKGFV